MSDGTEGGQGPAAPPDLAALARDWITLWQSELAALAADREAQEMSEAVLALWAGMAGSLLAAVPRARGPGMEAPAPGFGLDPESAAPDAPHAPPAAPGASDESADRRAGAAAPAGAAADPAAPGPGDAALERLHRRLAELESRLAALEREPAAPGRRPRRTGGGRAKPRRPSA